jgi:hypothetical protein
LRRFLKELGINTYKLAVTAELVDKIHDQTPVQWWRSVSRGSAAPDSRSVNEGLCLAMCLEAGDNVHFMREIICRRLLGLSFVVGNVVGRDNRSREWLQASALLPLNAMSSVSVDTQRMIDKEARRAQRTMLSTYASPRSAGGRSFGKGRGSRGSLKTEEHNASSTPKSPGHRGGGGGGFGFRGRGGGGGRGGGSGRGGSHSGAPSAPAQNGQHRAGGSGANEQ